MDDFIEEKYGRVRGAPNLQSEKMPSSHGIVYTQNGNVLVALTFNYLIKLVDIREISSLMSTGGRFGL